MKVAPTHLLHLPKFLADVKASELIDIDKMAEQILENRGD
jgi:hypothetical protein